MLSSIIGFLLKIGLGGIVDKTISLMEKKAALEVDKEKLKAEVTIEHIKASVEETRLLADLNKTKYNFDIYWVFVTLFVLPLGLWWAAIIVDSIFGFSWNIANLPTLQLQEWATKMIEFIFYTGGAIGVVKSLR